MTYGSTNGKIYHRKTNEAFSLEKLSYAWKGMGVIMNLLNNDVERLCSFYVSDWHLITMLLPYINKEIKLGG